jgi:hypothetical protein
MRREQLLVGWAFVTLALAGPQCLAKTASTPTDVPDRYRIELGGFRLGSNTSLRLNDGAGGGSDVSFEEDLDVPGTSTRFYLEGYWRIGRRHQVSLAWFRNNREDPGTTISKDITWGDHVFTASTRVQGEVGFTYVSGVYRFAAYSNDRVEVGPALGLGRLSVHASLRTIPDGTPSGSSTFERSVSQGQVTGDLGAYIYWWPAKRLLIRGDMRYILVKPENAEASITDGRVAVMYHPWPNVGIGIQYAYTKFRYDRDILSRALGGSLSYRGGQLLAAFAF